MSEEAKPVVPGDDMKITIPKDDKAPEGDDTPATEAPAKPAESDMVTEAMKQNEELKKQLEELKNNKDNVFEQNEALKRELEEQKKLSEIAKQNEELKGQLEAIKKAALIESLVSRGSINNELKGWASKLGMSDLEEFAKHAPKMKTILHEVNEGATQPQLDMEEWKKKMMKGRIIS